MGKMCNDEIIDVLGFYADAKPHPLYQQFYWLKQTHKSLTPERFILITRKLFQMGYIEGSGDDYLKQPLRNKVHVLTARGDEFYREIQFQATEDFDMFKRHERRELLHS